MARPASRTASRICADLGPARAVAQDEPALAVDGGAQGGQARRQPGQRHWPA